MVLLCAHLEGVRKLNFRIGKDNHVEFEDLVHGRWRRPTPVDLRSMSYHERLDYSRMVETTLNDEPERVKLLS